MHNDKTLRYTIPFVSKCLFLTHPWTCHYTEPMSVQIIFADHVFLLWPWIRWFAGIDDTLKYFIVFLHQTRKQQNNSCYSRVEPKLMALGVVSMLYISRTDWLTSETICITCIRALSQKFARQCICFFMM